MNVYQAIQKTEELTDIINALELALSRLESNEFSKQRRLIIEVKQKYFGELKELEDRMKDTQIKPVTHIKTSFNGTTITANSIEQTIK